MKTVIVYYSYGGKTKKYSNALAKETQVDVYEVDTLKKRSFIGNLFLECPKALTQKPTTIKDVNLDWSSYEKVVLAFPMWAGFPAPTFNNIVNILNFYATMLPYRTTEEFKRRICDAFLLIARVFRILC